MIAAAILIAGLAASAQPPARIAEVRVHGNATLADAEVIRLAGLTVGSLVTPSTVEDAASRLRDSGRFETVDVRERYRTLEMDAVAIVLLVHEKPWLSANGTPPGPLRRAAQRLMFLPIVGYDDGYGFTYGARASTVGLFGWGERLSVPATWGGTRRIALEADRTFTRAPVSRLRGSVSLSRRENPHFEVGDRRTEWFARAERRFGGHVTVGADVTRATVRFGPDRGRFWSPAADVTLDTRADPAFPADAVLLRARWDSLRQPGENGIRRYMLDARGYKRLLGQTVFAVPARLDRADAGLPPWEQWLLGGAGTVRGVRAATFVGDQRLVTSAELRIPISSPLHAGRTGILAFVDAGLVAGADERLRDAEVRRGAGAGVFLVAPLIALNLDVARGSEGDVRVHFSTGFSF